MSATHEVIVPGGAVTDVTDRVRLPGSINDEGFSVTANAEEGSVATSEVVLDDPDADLDLVGFNAYRIRETSAVGSNTNIWVGGMADRTIIRGPYRTGVGRQWKTALTDLNSNLSRRILTESYANRPAETDVARITALLGTNAFGPIDDTRYFSTASAVAMDARDWRGETAQALLDDCAQQSGKNYFVWYAGDTDELSLFYDFSSSAVYQSPIRLSNDLDDVDNVWTFAMSQDTELRRDPSRVASGIYLQWGDGQAAYEQDIDTAIEFSHRDLPMDGYAVKSQAKATARAQRYLTQSSTEEDVLTTTVIFPAAKVNELMQGMRVQFRGTHFPDYTEFSWGRVLNRTVTQVSEEFYAVRYEISVGPPGPAVAVPCDSGYAATPSGHFDPMHTADDSTEVLYYHSPGGACPEVPTAHYDGGWPFPEFGTGGSPDFCGDCFTSQARVMVVGAGTLEVHTATYMSDAKDLVARLQHRHTGDPDVTIDDEQSGPTGTTFTFAVSTHGGTECIHWVDVGDEGGDCGGKWGFAGADWVSSEA